MTTQNDLAKMQHDEAERMRKLQSGEVRLYPITAPTGWICPSCGAGCAPWSSRCPCKPLATTVTITCGGST